MCSKVWYKITKLLHVEQGFLSSKISMWTKIAPHENFGSTDNIRSVCDKYDVWCHPVPTCPIQFTSFSYFASQSDHLWLNSTLLCYPLPKEPNPISVSLWIRRLTISYLVQNSTMSNTTSETIPHMILGQSGLFEWILSIQIQPNSAIPFEFPQQMNQVRLIQSKTWKQTEELWDWKHLDKHFQFNWWLGRLVTRAHAGVYTLHLLIGTRSVTQGCADKFQHLVKHF